MNKLFLFFLIVVGVSSCTVAKDFPVGNKYGYKELEEDYTIFREMLEETHPGLYWYTSKDSMDYYFEKGRSLLQDSMSEVGFRNVLTYVSAKIRCGHTSVKPSKSYSRQTRRSSRFFPLVFKLWEDTAIVTLNLHRNDSLVPRGSLVTAIDGQPITYVIDTLFQHLPTDGYNLTHKYQTLSNRGVFGYMYSALYGYKPKYNIQFVDTAGKTGSAAVPLFIFRRDTTRKEPPTPTPSRKDRKKQMLQGGRDIIWDTTLNMAVMDLSTFTREYQLRRFFRSSFKKLKKQGTQNLVIDLRGNGGGSVTNSNLLTKYLVTKPFKIADSLYAVKRGSKYGRYQDNRFLNWLFLVLMTRKKKDGNYHFRHFERKYFKPKKRNHYNGHVYFLIGGNTFSASTLVISAVKDQPNVTVVGEETGGGAYGNNAWLIPDVTLPNTKVRFRLPLFRLVLDASLPKNGRGIMPDVEAGPTVKDIRRNVDYKMEKVKELIKQAPPRQ